MLSKGLPLPLAGRSVACDRAADVDDGVAGVSAGLNDPAVGVGDADMDADVLVELAPPFTVDVMALPVLMPVGPMTTGTTTWSVLPLASVVVLVMVVLLVLLWSFCLGSVEVRTRCVVCVGCSTISVAAAYAASMTCSGIGASMAAQYSWSGPRTSSSAHSAALH